MKEFKIIRTYEDYGMDTFMNIHSPDAIILYTPYVRRVQMNDWVIYNILRVCKE